MRTKIGLLPQCVNIGLGVILHFLPLRTHLGWQKRICLSVSTLLSIWIRVNGAKRVNDARLLTTFNLLKTTYNYRKVIPMTWLVVSFFLSCYLFANDPEMTPTYIEDKHEFNLQHISLLVIISVRQATFYSDFKDLPRSHNHESSINDTSHSD